MLGARLIAWFCAVLMLIGGNVHAEPVELLVPLRTIQAGERLNVADLSPKRFYVSDVGARNYLRDAAEIAGREAVRTLASGKPIAIAFLRPMAAVRKGRLVTGYMKSRGLTIETRLLPLEDGAAGQVIRVRNPATGRELRAQALIDGSVEVPQP